MARSRTKPRRTGTTPATAEELELGRQCEILERTVYDNPFIPKIDKAVNGKRIEEFMHALAELEAKNKAALAEAPI
jgi:hypothetical protein